MKVLKV